MAYVALILIFIVALLALLYGVFGKTPKHGILFPIAVAIDKGSEKFWARFDKIGTIIWRISLIVFSIGLFLILVFLLITHTTPQELSTVQVYAMRAAINNTFILVAAQGVLLLMVYILRFLRWVCVWFYEDALYPSLLKPMKEKLGYVRQAIVSITNKCSEKWSKRKLDNT